VGLGKYIKKAFLFHWNLLAFAGGMGFALISGHPDVFAPLVLAAEAAYLGFIGTHPRFQRHVDAQEHKAARAQANAEAVVRLMRALPPQQLRRFQALKERCLSVREIAEQLREPDGAPAMRSLDELQLSDLDRLLWIYLRTLYTQHMLERFFQSTSAQEIQSEITRLEDRLRRLDKEPESPNRTRIRQSLAANLETAKSRLANLKKARENYELLQAEIENLESKIQSITELAINRSDAEAITGQVQEITEGLVRTEQTINDLGFSTGVESFDLTVPKILPREVSGEAELEPDAAPPPQRRQDEIQFL
jgi:hypothetical protein